MPAQARIAAAALAVGFGLWAAPPAPAATSPTRPPDPNRLISPPTLDRPPTGRTRSAQEVLAIADRDPKVRETLRREPGGERYAYMKGPGRWQVSYFSRERPGEDAADRREIAQLLVDDRSGAVLESWNGHQVAWTMARGYPGAFGRRAAALYVWIPLTILFLVPFADRRRLRSWRNADLAALLGFSVSLAFFSHGRIAASVPLAYPPLAYLLVRMLLAARARSRERPDHPAATGTPPLRLGVPMAWLLVALIFLVGFRIGLNVLNSNVIDVGYAGVIGANRLVEGERLYGTFPDDNDNGDTYGPVVYYAYVPFERIWPWTGGWDDLPAAHGAAVAFDLATLVLLFLLGRRLRGPTLGVALAYGWAAYPFTLFVSSSNSNDSLVAALLVGALLVAASPVGRGAVAALAALTKFAPLALVPLLALYRPPEGGRARRGRRRVLLFALAFVLTTAAAMAPVVAGGDLGLFYERTVAYQRERSSPFSLWGLVGGLEAVQLGLQVGVAALALAVAFLPRRRDVVTLAALAAAVIVATQLVVTHWFYLYVVWFFPLVLLVMLTEDMPPPWRGRATTLPEREAGSARSSPPASVALR